MPVGTKPDRRVDSHTAFPQARRATAVENTYMILVPRINYKCLRHGPRPAPLVFSSYLDSELLQCEGYQVIPYRDSGHVVTARGDDDVLLAM